MSLLVIAASHEDATNAQVVLVVPEHRYVCSSVRVEEYDRVALVG